jgi:hypothetical protein
MSRMPRPVLSALSVLAVLLAASALAACGGDDAASTTTAAKSSSDRSTTTVGNKNTDSRAERIGQKVVNSDVMDTVDSKMQTCVGQAFIDGFGKDAESVATTADKRSKDLTAAQVKVLAGALDDCIPGTAFAKFYMATLYQQAKLGDPDPAAVDCLAGKVDGKVGQVASAFNADTSAAPPEFVAALDECVPQAALAGLIKSGLTQAGSGTTAMTAAQADCVAAAVAPQVKFSQLSKGNTTELQALIRASITACPG